MEDRTYRRC